MFTTGNEEWCPAMLFKRYLEKRPREMEKSCPFYLPVINKSVSSIWYKKTPIGKDTIDRIMENNMKENSPLKDLREKNLTLVPEKNMVKRLKSSGILKVKEYHTPPIYLRALRLRLRRRMRAADHFHEPLTTLVLVLQCTLSHRSLSCKFHCIFVVPSHVYNFSHCSVTLNITRNDA